MLKKLWSKIAEFFTVVGSAIWEFIQAAIPPTTEMALEQVQELAVAIVAEISNTNLSDEEKRKLAFDKIKEILETKKSDMKDGIVNLAIELAVQWLKQRKK